MNSEIETGGRDKELKRGRQECRHRETERQTEREREKQTDTQTDRDKVDVSQGVL